MVWYAAVYLQNLVLTVTMIGAHSDDLIFWKYHCLILLLSQHLLNPIWITIVPSSENVHAWWKTLICVILMPVSIGFAMTSSLCMFIVSRNTEVPWRGFPLKKFSVVSFSWKYTLPRSYSWRLNSQSPKDTIPHIECLLRNLLWDTFLLNEPSELSGNKFWQ